MPNLGESVEAAMVASGFSYPGFLKRRWNFDRGTADFSRTLRPFFWFALGSALPCMGIFFLEFTSFSRVDGVKVLWESAAEDMRAECFLHSKRLFSKGF